MAKRYNLNDVAILIPIRIDSIQRLDNLLSVINYLDNNISSNIYLLEADKYDRGVLRKCLPSSVSYTFIPDDDPIFHRTRYINELADMSKESILVIYDADVIISPSQLLRAAKHIRYGIADVVFPYEGTFLNVCGPLKEIFIESHGDISILDHNIGKMEKLYKTIQNGGAIFISRECFYSSGKEDINYYGWGQEDWNRFEKWRILGFKIERLDGVLYHLHHPRDINGKHSSYLQQRICKSLLCETKYSSRKTIQKKYDLIRNNSEELKYDLSSGRWIHNSFDGHVYDEGLSKALIKISEDYNIKTVIDLGCGTGWYVADLNDFGVDTIGFDGNPNVLTQSSRYPGAAGRCFCKDLSRECEGLHKADLVISIEVGEHIPPDKEDIFIDNICNCINKYLLISWAQPNQKGDGHVNCQTIQYIIDKFNQRGLKYHDKVSSEIRDSCSQWWTKQNILYFEKST